MVWTTLQMLDAANIPADIIGNLCKHPDMPNWLDDPIDVGDILNICGFDVALKVLVVAQDDDGVSDKFRKWCVDRVKDGRNRDRLEKMRNRPPFDVANRSARAIAKRETDATVDPNRAVSISENMSVSDPAYDDPYLSAFTKERKAQEKKFKTMLSYKKP